MKDFLVVAISGAAGAGKDTAANALRDRRGFSKAQFAGPLKAGLCAMFDWDPKLIENREWKEAVFQDIGKSPRQMMQTLGTEWGRELVNPDLWLLLAKRQIESARRSGAPGIVFSDCRFPNEARLVREEGGQVILVQRPDVAAIAAHVTEAGLPQDLIDGIAFNKGSVEDLGNGLIEMLEFVGVL